MALPVMPAGVPYKPRRDEWSMPQPFIPPLATDMEGGNTRLRSQPGSDVAIIQQTIRMTPAEYQAFDAFVRGTLNNGTSRFSWSVWLGAAYATKTVQFTGGGPTPTDGGRKIAVAMKLMVFGMSGA